jgi:hypothetical protein
VLTTFIGEFEVRFKGFIGPAYTLKSLNVEAQRCVNLYPEMNEAGTGKEGEVAHLLATPGLTNILDVGNGPIRMIYEDPRQTIFVASGNKMYKISYSGSVWSRTLLGSLSTSSGTVRAASNMLSNGDSITAFVDGTDSYAYKYVASVESFGTYASFGYSQVDGATHVEYIDGYFIFNDPSTSEFFVSQWGSFGVDPLSFASAEGDPDNVVAIIANHRDLWLINERTSEVFVNTGNPDFPFERVQGGFIQVGCIAPHSVAEINGVILWLGRDKSGQGIVYASESLQPQRVSTHAIETAIQGYDIDSVKSADAYTYSAGGHSFYVLNFPATTWVFDLTTKLWHERAYDNEGTLERHRSQHHAYISQYGIHLVGDYEDNRIYKIDDSVFTDDSTPIIRIRSTPHVSSDGKRIFCKSFQLDMEVGVGLTAGAQGSDPQVMLDWSDDGGHTWSNEHWASAGAIGQYRTRAKWDRLGCFRDRVFRVRVSDPVKVALLGASLDAEGGMS